MNISIGFLVFCIVGATALTIKDNRKTQEVGTTFGQNHTGAVKQDDRSAGSVTDSISGIENGRRSETATTEVKNSDDPRHTKCTSSEHCVHSLEQSSPVTTTKATNKGNAENNGGPSHKVPGTEGVTTERTGPKSISKTPSGQNSANDEHNPLTGKLPSKEPIKQATLQTLHPTTQSTKKPGIGLNLSSTTESVQETVKPEEDDEDEVCFPVVGCFAMGKPWKSVARPIRKPFSPEKIQTTIFFSSREYHPDQHTNITLHPTINMNGARFNPQKLTAIIVHGFASSGNATWMTNMKKAFLKQVDANLMLVDWEKGSSLFNYLQVAGNTRVVGKQLGMFVKHLKENYGADPGKFHLIGHSLGAQICSYLAKEVPGIARLTALDPAQPGFEGFDKLVRLDKSDAEFVDVIHTSAKPLIPTFGFGMIAPYGHVDFYMNGGFDQPGCIAVPKEELPPITNILDLAKFPVEVLAKVITCPHSRSYDFLIEAFNETEKCVFWGHKANAENVLKSVTNTITQGVLKKVLALTTTCNKENCIPLGFATKKSPLRGSFVVTTAGGPPFCISEPGVPTESEGASSKQDTNIQKIARKVGAIKLPTLI
ncbi:hypothetical protein RUM44_000795 [Polyplax serrata]|uniref:Lipase domain-containing protein n=1 Tax=Polyplax serrata TaxID=468196 RepID=A0ABR1B675_POLSC